MIIWHRGAAALEEVIQSLAMPVDYFIGHLLTAPVARVPGTAVFLTEKQFGYAAAHDPACGS